MDCVTKGVSSGVHRLRNTLVHISTCTGLGRRQVAADLTTRTLDSLGRNASSRRLAVRRVRGGITGCCRIAISRLQNGGHIGAVIVPHRVTVCLSQGLASTSLPEVKRSFNNGSRAAIVRTCSGVAGTIGGSDTVGGSIGTLLGRLGQ